MEPSAYQRIFHPFLNRNESTVAFAHALKISMAARSELQIMHILSKEEEHSWELFPKVRDRLSKWGELSPSASVDEVAKIGPKVSKVMAPAGEPLPSLLGFLNDHPTDLIVLATHGAEGLKRAHTPKVAEPLARSAGVQTLFFPEGAHGFIDLNSGSVRLARVLIPVSHQPDPTLAVEAAVDLAYTLKAPNIEFTLLYVGEKNAFPAFDTPTSSGWIWNRVSRAGDVAAVIENVATETEADLVVMATKGHDGFLDMLRGSTTERVLRSVKCPLLAVPFVTR